MTERFLTRHVTPSSFIRAWWSYRSWPSGNFWLLLLTSYWWIWEKKLQSAIWKIIFFMTAISQAGIKGKTKNLRFWQQPLVCVATAKINFFFVSLRHNAWVRFTERFDVSRASLSSGVTLTFDRTKFLCFSPFGLTHTPQFFEKLIGSLRIS